MQGIPFCSYQPSRIHCKIMSFRDNLSLLFLSFNLRYAQLYISLIILCVFILYVFIYFFTGSLWFLWSRGSLQGGKRIGTKLYLSTSTEGEKWSTLIGRSWDLLLFEKFENFLSFFLTFEEHLDWQEWDLLIKVSKDFPFFFLTLGEQSWFFSLTKYLPADASNLPITWSRWWPTKATFIFWVRWTIWKCDRPIWRFDQIK